MNKMILYLHKRNTAMVSLVNPVTGDMEMMSTYADNQSVSMCIAIFAAEQDIPPSFVEVSVTWPEGHQLNKAA